MKTALGAPATAQEELLNLYNLATALDPALVALTRAYPFYEGRADGFAARTVHYRGMLGLDGLYADLQEVGAASTRGNLHRASWNPIRLNYHGTVEIRSMDANLPEVILAVCALICGAVDRLRHERLSVRPTRQVRTIELDGDELLVPTISYLSGELLEAAVTYSVLDQRIEAFLDSFVRFACAYAEEPDLVESLECSGSGYRTTEAELLRSFPLREASVRRDQGLSLVQWSCRRLSDEVSSLQRKHHRARHEGEHVGNTRGLSTPLKVARIHPTMNRVE